MNSRRAFLVEMAGVGVLATQLGGQTVTAAQSDTSNWQTFQGDSRRSGFTSAVEAPVSDIEIEWRYEVENPIYTQPIRDDGRVVISAIGASEDTGQLVGLGTDGVEQWSQSLPLSVLSTPTIRNGRLFHATPESVTARSMRDGSIEWSVELANSVFCSPLVVDDTIFLGTRTGTLQALSVDDGSDRWSTTLSGVVSATPAANDDFVVAGTDDGTVAGLEIENGDVGWRRNIGEPVRCPVTITENLALIATEAGRLRALDLESGQQQWSTDSERPSAGSPVFVDGICYWNRESRVSAINVADGTEQWTVRTDGYTALNHVSPSPVATEKTLYVTTGQTTVYALDRSDGSERWTFTPPSEANVVSLAVGAGRLYIGTDQGTLYVLSGRTNRRPEPSFTYVPRDPNPGDEITFDASGSHDPDGSIEAYRWDFDDDEEFESNGETISRTFEEGDYSVRLEVVDSEGARATTESRITISSVTTVATSDGSNDGVARYLDQVPGGEFGVAGGAVGLLGAVGLYRRLSGDQTEAEESSADSAAADTQFSVTPSVREQKDDVRIYPGIDRDVTFKELNVGELLGSGILTEVSNATLSTAEEPLAVETLSGSSGHTVHEGLFERFADGLDIWSRIDDHRNIVSVVASGTEPFPWAGLEKCMSQLRPETVADHSFSRIRALLVDVLEGVHHGHRHGLSHGALAPTNVLLLPANRAGEEEPIAVVSDWGVSAAKLDSSLNAKDSHPKFAAPEHLAPEQFGDPDSLTDIYQVGVLAYALTTGSYPFDGSIDTVDARDTDMITPPSNYDSDIPTGFDEIIETALATDPKDRYQTSLHFRDALERL